MVLGESPQRATASPGGALASPPAPQNSVSTPSHLNDSRDQRPPGRAPPSTPPLPPDRQAAQQVKRRGTRICWRCRYRWAAPTSVAFSESGACGSWLGVKRSRLVMVRASRGPQRSPETNTQGQNTDGTVQHEVTWLSRQLRGRQQLGGDTLSLLNGRDDWPEMEKHLTSGKKQNRPPQPRRKCVLKRKKKKVRGSHTTRPLCSPTRRGKAGGCTATGLGAAPP